jgi:hypothetical protein
VGCGSNEKTHYLSLRDSRVLTLNGEEQEAWGRGAGSSGEEIPGNSQVLIKGRSSCRVERTDLGTFLYLDPKRWRDWLGTRWLLVVAEPRHRKAESMRSSFCFGGPVQTRELGALKTLWRAG